MRTDLESGEAATLTGFSTEFLDAPINLPDHRSDIAEDLVQINGSHIIDYAHFSLVLSRSRKFARWVGWNIDGTHLQLLSRTGINFTKDPRIPDQYQAGNELYSENWLDRGHLARRADLTWGGPPLRHSKPIRIPSTSPTSPRRWRTSINPGKPAFGAGWKMPSTRTWSSTPFAAASSPAPSYETKTSTTGVTRSLSNTGRSSSLNGQGSSPLGRFCSPRIWTDYRC